MDPGSKYSQEDRTSKQTGGLHCCCIKHGRSLHTESYSIQSECNAHRRYRRGTHLLPGRSSEPHHPKTRPPRKHSSDLLDPRTVIDAPVGPPASIPGQYSVPGQVRQVVGRPDLVVSSEELGRL
uniref:Uncharacterized protein n=1 Tax=Salix viminalis TaxID=40686 RepID=A0A6N2LIT8_SALVM